MSESTRLSNVHRVLLLKILSALYTVVAAAAAAADDVCAIHEDKRAAIIRESQLAITLLFLSCLVSLFTPLALPEFLAINCPCMLPVS